MPANSRGFIAEQDRTPWKRRDFLLLVFLSHRSIIWSGMISSFSVHMCACAHVMHSKDQLSRACMPLHMYKHILPYMSDDGVGRTASDQTRIAEVPWCRACAQVRKEYIIEHSGICIQWRSSKAMLGEKQREREGEGREEKEWEKERERKREGGKRKHSMPMQKDRPEEGCACEGEGEKARERSEVTLVLFFVAQSWIEPAYHHSLSRTCTFTRR